MTRGMEPTKAKLVVTLLISAILVVSSATVEDPVVVECKNQCKHIFHNKKECEDGCNEKMMMKEDEQDPFCDAFCKAFLEDGEEMYQRCMNVCPRTKSLSERQEVEGFDGVANGDLQTKCNRKCTSYTEPHTHKRCMSQCFKSMISKRTGNEAVCESSCSILQETPLIIRCVRVCHDRIPGPVST